MPPDPSPLPAPTPQTSSPKPNNQASPGSVGNTPGLITPKPDPNGAVGGGQPTALTDPPAATETPKETSFWGKISGGVHTGLDVLGFIPGLGAIPDLANAGLYALEGDMVSAGISAVAAVPGIGDAAKAGTMAVKGAKAVGKKVAKEVAEEAAEKAAKEAAEKAAKEAAERAAKEAAEKAEKEAAEKAAKEKAEKEAAEAGGKGGNGGNKKGGGGKNICKIIAGEIWAKSTVLSGRIADLLRDKLDLFNLARSKPSPSLPKGSGSWDGHVHQAKGVQQGLRNSIGDYDAAKCKEPRIPKALRDLAYAPIPTAPN